jgi:hypothetical protein
MLLLKMAYILPLSADSNAAAFVVNFSRQQET